MGRSKPPMNNLITFWRPVNRTTIERKIQSQNTILSYFMNLPSELISIFHHCKRYHQSLPSDAGIQTQCYRAPGTSREKASQAAGRNMQFHKKNLCLHPLTSPETVVLSHSILLKQSLPQEHLIYKHIDVKVYLESQAKKKENNWGGVNFQELSFKSIKTM